MNTKLVRVLLVEDDRVDVIAVKRAFRALKIANPITEARDGIEALQCLRGDSGSAPLPPPYLVLLDLNMPRMDGLEFLAEVRKDPSLRSTLVFVMTTSSSQEDRMRAHAFNVAGYVLKYRLGESFVETMSMLEHYWQLIEFPVSIRADQSCEFQKE